MTQGIDPTQWRDSQERKQNELNEVLVWLRDNEIESKEQLTDVASKMLAIYSDKSFRHHYSDILEIIHVIDDERIGGQERVQRVKVRGENLAAGIRQLYLHECDEGCERDGSCPIKELQRDHRLHKLYDHVNLEARRASYEAQTAQETVAELQNAREQLKAAKDALEEATDTTERTAKDAVATGERAMSASKNAQSIANAATKRADEVSARVKKQQIEMVSVLGVFSAIILAFNEGVVFSTSSIAAADRQSPYQIAFVVAIVGLVLFNCLYCALALVYQIIRSDNDARHLMSPKRLAGIELAVAACVASLGIIAHPSSLAIRSPHFVALVLSIVTFGIGIYLILKSGEKRGRERSR